MLVVFRVAVKMHDIIGVRAASTEKRDNSLREFDAVDLELG